jgi:DnaJ-class molecular chaperone
MVATLEPKPCSHCHGRGWVEQHGKEVECQVCQGTGRLRE